MTGLPGTWQTGHFLYRFILFFSILEESRRHIQQCIRISLQHFCRYILITNVIENNQILCKISLYHCSHIIFHNLTHLSFSNSDFVLKCSGRYVQQCVGISLKHFCRYVLVAYLAEKYQILCEIVLYHCSHIIFHNLTHLSFSNSDFVLFR